MELSLHSSDSDLVTRYYPVMMKLAVSLAFVVLLSACHIVYRPSVQQGNILEQSGIAQLKLGMTKEQVYYLLGSPVLQPTFQKNRNDYVYFYRPGYGKPVQHRVTLIFSGGRLSQIKQGA